MKKTVAFYTLGCRVNQYETAAMESLFEKAGYRVLPFTEKADVYVINTCTVTAESDRKCRQILRRAKKLNPLGVVAAVGCMAQGEADVLRKMPEVDVILGVTHKGDIVSAVESAVQHPVLVDDLSKITAYQPLFVDSFPERDRAFVKIQDGCDRFCSYCIIPYVRGRVRSRDEEEILAEIRGLSEKGFSEVVLTGIHVASYGRGTETNLSRLIRRVAEIPEISRIRLSSIDPNAFDEDLYKTYAEISKLCPHFHISLQSGSATVLKRMNRRYTPDFFASVLAKLRKIRPDTAITTDIIVGFPGETEAEFEETLAFAEKVQLSGIHVFPYSIRKGTKAAEMDGQVPKGMKETRAKRLAEKAITLREEYGKSFIGTVLPVLFEQSDDAKGGFTPHFMRVQVEGIVPTDIYGKILPVEITDCKGEILYGIHKS